MNVALPALIIFVLLLPGFSFRVRLKRAERTSLDYSPFGQVVAEAVMWALVLHVLWLGIGRRFGFEFDPYTLLNLLGPVGVPQAEAAQRVAAEFDAISLYFLTLLPASYALPRIARSLIEKFRVDRDGSRFGSFFRFHGAPWYYLLTSADFRESEEPDFIFISAIVDVSGDPFLYLGVLDEFFVDSDGNLDRLILQRVVRRPISADKTGATVAGAASRFYEIEGDYFVLRYSEAITLNVQYVKLTETAPLTESKSPTGDESALERNE